MADADEIRRRMPAIIAGEVAAINRTLAGTRPGRTPPAKTGSNWTFVAGRAFIAYGLRLDSTVLPQDIEKLLPKLSEAMSALRRRPTDVRLRRKPLALEVAHPFPAPLDWHKANTALQPDTMLTGRNYSGGEPCDDTVSLADMAHILAVGMTGSGKSTLLRMMIGSLAFNTSPDALRLFIVDPKAEDFLEFERLPHCEMFASRQDVTRAIARVRGILADRQDTQGRFDGPRVVLFLDELSQVKEPNAIKQLNDLMSVGRSKRINVILSTQYPTKDVIGKVDLSNVGVRFVGQVATSPAAVIAAGHGGTGADLLPGNGAFLRIEGPTATRLQAYWLDDAGTEALVDAAVQRWGQRAVQAVHQSEPAGGADAVRTGAYTGAPAKIAIVRAVQPEKQPISRTGAPVRFPLPRNRPPTPEEAAALRELYGRTGSQNQTVITAYGTKSQLLVSYVKQAIEGGAA